MVRIDIHYKRKVHKVDTVSHSTERYEWFPGKYAIDRTPVSGTASKYEPSDGNSPCQAMEGAVNYTGCFIDFFYYCRVYKTRKSV